MGVFLLASLIRSAYADMWTKWGIKKEDGWKNGQSLTPVKKKVLFIWHLKYVQEKEQFSTLKILQQNLRLPSTSAPHELSIYNRRPLVFAPLFARNIENQHTQHEIQQQ